jgi:hypothetical protein
MRPSRNAASRSASVALSTAAASASDNNLRASVSWARSSRHRQHHQGSATSEATEAELALLYMQALEKLAGGNAAEAKRLLGSLRARIDRQLDEDSETRQDLLVAVHKNLARANEALGEFEAAAKDWAAAVDLGAESDVPTWLGLLECARRTSRASLYRLALDTLRSLRPGFAAADLEVGDWAPASAAATAAAAGGEAWTAAATKSIKPTFQALAGEVAQLRTDELCVLQVLAAAGLPTNVPPAAALGQAQGSGAAPPASPPPAAKRARRQPKPSQAASSSQSSAQPLEAALLPLADLDAVSAAKDAFEAMLDARPARGESGGPGAAAGREALDEAVEVRRVCARGPRTGLQWMQDVAMDPHVPDASLCKLLPIAQVLSAPAAWRVELAAAAVSQEAFVARRERALLARAAAAGWPADPDTELLVRRSLRHVAERARLANKVRRALQPGARGADASGSCGCRWRRWTCSRACSPTRRRGARRRGR